MPSIRPALIVGAGDHTELAAALRARGLGPMLAPDVEQATRLLRNFRVDVMICVRLSKTAVRKLAERAPTVVIGGTEAEAWDAGAAGFVDSSTAMASVMEVVHEVARGQQRVRARPHPQHGRGIA